LSGKPQIKYQSGDQTLLNEVRSLWEELNQYHCERSEHFKEHYLTMTWQKRRYTLLKRASGGALYVEIAHEELTGRQVGYIVASLNVDKTGEVESIYVQTPYRGMGIGDRFMRDALDWMEQNGAKEKQVEVSVGNEERWGFYGRYGFMPRKTLLKQVKKA
jgi:ribosomal protein S18 acetylase RimI-like enzyme